MITYTKKTDHITPVLAGLHWLPIQQRNKYKLCLIIFKILQGGAPAYLSDLVQIYTPGHRGLRSTKHKLFLNEIQQSSGLDIFVQAGLFKKTHTQLCFFFYIF